MTIQENKYIILFDGECNLCSFWVKYTLERDKKDIFRFASLQSKIGKKYLNQLNIKANTNTVILIEEDRYFRKSTVALHVLKNLGGIQSIFYGFIIIPTFIRDFFYDLIAKHRYQLFGTKACELPLNKNYAHKFLI